MDVCGGQSLIAVGILTVRPSLWVKRGEVMQGDGCGYECYGLEILQDVAQKSFNTAVAPAIGAEQMCLDFIYA